MVHAELGSPPCDVLSPAGVCCAGVSAFKYGFMNVVTGSCDNAVVTGSELSSPSLRASHFGSQLRPQAPDLDDHPLLPFSNEFLRWMLSDGAGALLIRSQPNPDRPVAAHRLGRRHVLRQRIRGLHVFRAAEARRRHRSELAYRRRRRGPFARRLPQSRPGREGAERPAAGSHAQGRRAHAPETRGLRPDERRLAAASLLVAMVSPALVTTAWSSTISPFRRSAGSAISAPRATPARPRSTSCSRS